MVVGRLDARALGAATELLAESCAFEQAHVVAGEKLFGRSPAGGDWAAGAWDGDTLVGVASGAGKWLRLLAVRPPARGRGAGSALLSFAVERAKRSGASSLRACDQPGNYLAPGVDERDVHTIAWLEWSGFVRDGVNRNLLVTIGPEWRDRARDAVVAAKRVGYTVRRAGAADAAKLDEAARSFSPAWAFEVARGVTFIAEKDGLVAAFASHDANNRTLGWFGPAGTRPDHRRHGLGRALLAACIDNLAARGAGGVEIAWAGAEAFYARELPEARERRFLTLARPI